MKFSRTFKIHWIKARAIAAFGLCLVVIMSEPAPAQNRAAAQNAGSPTPPAKERDKVVNNHASGPFEVKVTPQASDGDDSGLGRMSLDKQFHGDLEATSKGQMLAAMSPVQGSGGYVAMERVTGTLKGRSGTFVLQHSGTMQRGVPQMTVTVVPDSGTGQLVGLAGVMTIKIADGKHSYDLEYTIAETP